MQKFKFKLEKVLDYRHQEEDMLRQELAEIQERLRKAESKLNSLLNEKREIQIKLKKKEKNNIDLQQAISYRDYLKVLKIRIKNQRETVNQVQHEANKCRQKLLDKRKECKTLSKLKEKEFTKYRREFLREEQKEIDEIATSNFNRRTDNAQVVI